MPAATSVTITEAARNFSDFINRVAYRQEVFYLVRGKKTVAELRPVVSGRRIAELSALFREGPSLEADDWGAFQRDLDKSRSRR